MNSKKISSVTTSLLRYPGSKAKLSKILALALEANGYKGGTFVEPFCGGASASLALLESDIVDNIVLNDADYGIAALWKCVFSKDDSEWLAEQVLSVPITLDYFYFLKSYRPKTIREAALKCLYINRTSFSGIINERSGPIGGKRQGKWKLGCRFNREKIACRINKLSMLRERVLDVTNKDWSCVCNKYINNTDTAFYFDPPFYNKAERLYNCVFSQADHIRLSKFLADFKKPWILSYDNAREIRCLYDNMVLNAFSIDSTYSAHPIGGNSIVGKEVMYTNLKILPCPSRNDEIHSGIKLKILNCIFQEHEQVDMMSR